MRRTSLRRKKEDLELRAVGDAINRAIAFRKGELSYLHCPELQVYDDLLWRVWDENRRANNLVGRSEGSPDEALQESAEGQAQGRKPPTVAGEVAVGAVPINYAKEPPR